MTESLPDTKPSPILGPLVQIHQVRPARRYLLPLAIIFCLTLAAAAFLVGIWRWYFALTTFGPIVIWRWSWFPLTIGLFFVFISFLLVFAFWRQPTMEVRVFRHGIILFRGLRRIAIQFSEITKILTLMSHFGLPGLKLRSGAEVVIEMDDDRQFRLTSMLKDFELLVETIKRNVYPDLLSKYTEAFNHGNPLAFGPILVTQQGVQSGATLVTWNTIAQAALSDGELKILVTNSNPSHSLKIPASEVPNVDLCVQLIQQLGQQQ